MQELFTNENEDLAYDLLCDSFNCDMAIKSKYLSLKDQGYELKAFSMVENLRASRNMYPIYMLYTVYRFKKESGETAEIVVDPLGRMYKGSYAMYVRFAKFEESNIYGSGEYQEFLAFSEKCLDCIMKIPKITHNNPINFYRELKTLNGSIAKAFELLFADEENLPLWLTTPSRRVSYKEKEAVRNLIITMARAQFVERYMMNNDGLNSFINQSIYKDENGEINNRALDILNVLAIPLHEYDRSNFAKGVLGYAFENCNESVIRILFSNGLGFKELPVEATNTIKMVISSYFNSIPDDLIIKTIEEIVNAAILIYKDEKIEDKNIVIYNFALSKVNPTIASIKIKQPGVFDNLVPELTYKDVCNLIITGKNVKDSDRTRIISGLVMADDKQAYVNSRSQDFFALFCTNIKDMFRIYGKIKSYDDEIFDQKATKLICNRYTVQNLDTESVPDQYKEMYERLIPINESNKSFTANTLEKLLNDENSDEVERELIETLLGKNF